MPKLYNFPQVKCSENENYRYNSLGGCRYEPKIPEFKPHNKGPKGTIKPFTPQTKDQKPTIQKPPVPITPQPVTPQTPSDPTTKPTTQPTILQPSTVQPTILQPSTVQPTIQQPLTSQPVTPPTLSPPFNMRPLKQIEKLTEEQITKAKMVNLGYKIHEMSKHREEQGMVNRTLNETLANDILDDHDFLLQNQEIDGYKINEKLSNKDVLILQAEKNNDVKIIWRGNDGDNPRPEDIKHIEDTLLNRKRDYKYIDELYTKLKDTYPNGEFETISYSNGGSPALYMSEKYNLKNYSIDPLYGLNELNLLRNRNVDSAPLELVRTSRPALAQGGVQTLHEIIDGNPTNTKIKNVAPLNPRTLNPIKDVFGDHGLENYITNEKPNVGLIGKNIGGSLVAGTTPLIAAGAITEAINPDAPEAVKIAEVSIGGSALQKVISPMVGAGAAPMSATLAPIAGSLVAAQGAGALADVVLPDSMPQIPRQTLHDAFAGAGGGLGYVGTQATGRAIGSAVSNIGARAAGYTALGEEVAGVEMAEIGAGAIETGEIALAGTEGVELAALGTAAAEGGIEAGLLSATEFLGAAAAAEGGLNPAVDIAFAAAATGAVIGGVVGLVGSLFGGTNQQQAERKRIQEQAERERIQEEYRLKQIRDMPAAPHGTHLINTIEADTQYQSFLNNGSIAEINQRIRNIVLENENHSSIFRDITSGFDNYPQLNQDGSWKMQKWNDPSPTTPLTDASVWRDEPHPQTSHEFTPRPVLPKYTSSPLNDLTSDRTPVADDATHGAS